MKDIRAKFIIPISPQSPDVAQNWDVGICDFQISGQSFINENCHNFRTSHNIDIKLGPVTKLDKDATTSKNIDDKVMSANRDFTVFFLIYG